MSTTGDKVSMRGERIATSLCGKMTKVAAYAWPEKWEEWGPAIGNHSAEVVAAFLDADGHVSLLLRPVSCSGLLCEVPARACEMI